MSFPGSENSLSIPGFQVFPGLWPPWFLGVRDVFVTCVAEHGTDRQTDRRTDGYQLCSMPPLWCRGAAWESRAAADYVRVFM